MVVPAMILEASGVHHVVMYAVDIFLSLFLVYCLLLIAYFYIMLYIGVRRQRKRNRTQNLQANAKLETKIAYTAFLLTLFVGISGIPTMVVYLFGGVSPILRESSIFR